LDLEFALHEDDNISEELGLSEAKDTYESSSEFGFDHVEQKGESDRFESKFFSTSLEELSETIVLDERNQCVKGLFGWHLGEEESDDVRESSIVTELSIKMRESLRWIQTLAQDPAHTYDRYLH